MTMFLVFIITIIKITIILAKNRIKNYYLCYGLLTINDFSTQSQTHNRQILLFIVLKGVTKAFV